VRLGISLDGSTPEIHDAFRGLPGAWARTIQAIEWANERAFRSSAYDGQPPQRKRPRQPVRSVREVGDRDVECFFSGSRGRGQLDDLLSGEQFEQVFGKIYDSQGGRISRSRRRRRCTIGATCCNTIWKRSAWAWGCAQRGMERERSGQESAGDQAGRMGRV